jgi:hypothetical protein
MPETPEGLLARLTGAGIATETRHHPAVFTVAESKDLRGTLPGGHTKNLFLRPAKGDGSFLLATLEESRQDAKLVSKMLFLLGSTFLPFKYPTIHPTKNGR